MTDQDVINQQTRGISDGCALLLGSSSVVGRIGIGAR